MSLDEYQKKRDLSNTPEPAPQRPKPDKVLRFVVHKHAASHLHYDFRLELDGVLKSWAIPKGPSLDPSIKRLALRVEDHPYEYRNFEGIIPKGNYGAGEVMIWDEGSYHALAATDKEESEERLRNGLYKGDLKFILDGHKLKGEFALVKIKSAKDNSWLLLKKRDEFATDADVILQESSVVSNATIEDIRGTNPTAVHGDKDLAPSKRKEPSSGKKPDMPEKIPEIEAPAAPMSHDIRPMLATSVKEPFDDPDWIFEIKHDGYRCIAEIDRGKVLIYSRNNLSFNQRFATIARALESIARDVVFDGEIVALDDKGRSSFQILKNNPGAGKENILYLIFDLLYLDGKDLRSLPLLNRKKYSKSCCRICPMSSTAIT